MSVDSTDGRNTGFGMTQACAYADSWKAAYGLELLRLTHEADVLGELTGEFIEPYYPTEEEFRDAMDKFRRGGTRYASRPGKATALLKIKKLVGWRTRPSY